MVATEISTVLLDMIDQVGLAETDRVAASKLLHPLLQVFDMDQASICEWDEKNVHTLFSMDRTRKLLPLDEPIWLSLTIFKRALQSFEAAVHTPEIELTDGIPKSISDLDLKSVICIPISRKPDRFVYLASRRDPGRKFSALEFSHLKTATRAAVLAFQQRSAFLELRQSNERLQKEVSSRDGHVLYASECMHMLSEEIARIAPFNICIRLQGESGTGKEVIAKEIHRLSGRTGRFIAVNCANLTETLLESELFGYARGAFTGATQAKKGLIQNAEGGTFLLDEIAELPMNLQSKLLRVLQERVVRAVGSNQDLPIDVRFIVASHRNLFEAVSAKEFREDLFYRINEHAIDVPPLRERMEDIEVLAEHFLHQFVREFKMPARRFTSEAIDRLRSHDWPGNIRELKNVLRTTLILSRNEQIGSAEVKLPVSRSNNTKPSFSGSSLPAGTNTAASVPEGSNLKQMTRQYETSLIEGMLSEPGQTQANVARKLGISVRTLQRLLEKDRESSPSIHIV